MNWPKPDLWCDIPHEHESHHHDVDVVIHCSGRTACGKEDHEPHDIKGVEQRWCPGICDCGLRFNKHGAGEHK